MNKHKTNEITVRELTQILKLKGKGLSLNDICAVISKKYKKEISPQGVKYLTDSFNKVNVNQA